MLLLPRYYYYATLGMFVQATMLLLRRHRRGQEARAAGQYSIMNQNDISSSSSSRNINTNINIKYIRTTINDSNVRSRVMLNIIVMFQIELLIIVMFKTELLIIVVLEKVMLLQ